MAEERPIGVDDPRLDDAALEALAEAHATPPPDRLRARVLAEARRDAALRATAAVARWRLVGSIAAAVALVLGGLLAREGRIGYRHALLRESVYHELPDPERAWLHERLAAAFDDPATPGRAAEVARHLRLAHRDAAAVEHLRRASVRRRSTSSIPTTRSRQSRSAPASPTATTRRLFPAISSPATTSSSAWPRRRWRVPFQPSCSMDPGEKSAERRPRW